MTTRLFLIRHGESRSNIEQRYQGQGESDLSQLGLDEAEELARYLSKQKFSAIYSSTLRRSFETAEMISKHHDLDVMKVPELIERNYGKWENMKFGDIKKRYGRIYGKWLIDPGMTLIPGAESLKALQKRGVAAIEKLVKKNKGRTFCVVGHGGINRTILFHYMNVDLNNFWRIRQANCCINVVEFNKHFPVVTLLNSTAHLGLKGIGGMGYY